MKLVLGSSSKSRQKILKEMGYEFDIVPAGIDEKAIRHPDPKQLTLLLARAKAKAVAEKLKEPAIVITSDQVGYFQGRIMEKPESEAEAREYLENAHLPIDTVTSVVVTDTSTGRQVEGVDVVTVTMDPLPADVIDTFIQRGDYVNYAGGFDIEDPLIKPYVKAFIGEPESVLGLPKTLTERLLKEIGYRK